MAVWDKLKQELDEAARVTQDALQKAGKAAQEAIDEGKVRIDAFRARQEADRAAQAFGYAVFRARKAGTELDDETTNRLFNSLADKEAEAARLESAASAGRTERTTGTSAEPPAQEPPPPV